jgi:hypothetical protein
MTTNISHPALKGAVFIFGFLMFIVSLALVAVSAKFSTYETLATIYIWVTAVVMFAEIAAPL